MTLPGFLEGIQRAERRVRVALFCLIAVELFTLTVGATSPSGRCRKQIDS